MGLSFGKLLLLAALAAVVWYWLKRPHLIEAVTRAVRREMRGQARPRPAGPAIEAEDLVKCERCGAYVAAHAGACGRPDCPRRRS
jgi:hypothetical protein